jgi:replication factor C large subunit
MIQQENIPWVEKHRVRRFVELKGQEMAVNRVKEFLKSFPKKKAIVLHGPPGTGKTSLAYAIAVENDCEILEMNASDLRNKQKVSEVIGPASQQKSLFRKGKIILVDEVDGISTKDRGGLSELLSLISSTNFPVIITANDIWQQKFSELRRKTELVQMKDIDYKDINSLLQKICEKENVVVSQDVLTSISIKSRGDVRAAINDLQILSKSDEPLLMKDMGDRNREQSIFQSLQYVFKNAQLDSKMLTIFDEVNMPIDQVFLWVEENIPLEYSGQELAKAFDALSIADVFRGRIYRQQHWRFMVYEYFLLSGGIAAAKKTNRGGWTSYKKPSRILKIWLQNQRAAKKKTICQKYARYCHISTKQAMKDFLLVRKILMGDGVRQLLKLSKDEIDYLDKPLIG